MSGRVRTEKQGPIGWIVFDHEARRNAISVAMWKGIPEAVRELEQDDAVRVIIMRGAGEEAFVAGADISEFANTRTGDSIADYDADSARAFGALGVPEEAYASAAATPTTRAFGDFLVRVGHEGRFEEIVTALYVTEGTYLDWGTRLGADRSPRNAVYQEWVDIHGPAVLGELVRWMGTVVDGAESNGTSGRVDDVFLTALRYEYLFFESAYRGESWPDE